ncbi:hypothetical protein A2763_00975 [Candidatus Kaiserbacteria bacterium RIFCSPHIGHO2_01_FULL_54_36]|uniref:SCP domain-containing protein n=1 Tax=Candidatus Kaiserbacteria bacterium RIFCSPHIGHO2_01_FULL_54_36 TaxID=1798482 RepID=A0A1F6CKH4_9BACT|nr:MAG: hypothetical protein A2763_00975 [Candidatus Kaiserbacteria bacterium RIFCSPHIGHO2_01_FULL_54_36]OGG75278.1 MAG: hypothetical protein A3A41_03215 [Candidatus Kaiserbacteria bacterium RIFCSPLOWO2_01_FULL_54_22]
MQKRELRLLEGAALAVMLVLIVGLFCISAIQTLSIRSGQAAAVISSVLVDLANGDRASQSLGTLRINPVLTAAAQAKADDMAAKGYFAHETPEGYDSWYWFKEAGYSFKYAGENLAVDFSDSADVERAWMQSPTHRDNLLDPHFTEIGIATAQGTFEGHATTFVVQMFATPAEAATIASIQEISAPQDATQPALATTEPAGTNVLGTSANEPEKVAVAAESKTIADIRQPDAKAPVGAVRYAPAWGFLATSPKTTLRYAYYITGFLVLLALVITTGLELRWHHARAFTVAACLLVFMSGLFVVADYTIFPDPVLADTVIATGSG